MNHKWINRLTGVFAVTAFALAGCGGGGADAGDTRSFVAAKSPSFDPSTAIARTATSANSPAVPIHWVYKVNNGNPVTASLNGASIGITVNSLEVSINPADLKRHAALIGSLSGNWNGTAVGGSYTVIGDDSLTLSGGKTYLDGQSLSVVMNASAGAESGTVQLNAVIKNLTPAYEWFLDRDNLDQLDIGTTLTNASAGTADVHINITGESPITKSNVAMTANDVWTVVEKIPGMVVQGKTYSNVVKVSRLFNLPDLSGNLTPVTVYYWVAKGVGVIKGQGLYRILNINDVIFELLDSNLAA